MNLQALVASAASAHGAGKLAEAAEICRQVLALDSQNVQAKLLLGVIEAKSGDPHKAIELLEQVQRMDPSSFQAPFWLSMTCRKLGMISKAVLAAAHAVAINPKDPQGQTQLGICYMDDRQLIEAEKTLRHAAKLAPDVVPIQCHLSRCLILQGKTDEALVAIKHALSRTNPNEETLIRFGNLLLSQDNWLGAAQFGRLAVQRFPRSVKARLLLARALLEENHGGEAEKHLRQAVEIDPNNNEAISRLGTALQSLGQIEEASLLFSRSLELEPNQGYAYFALFHNRKVTAEDRPMLERMQQLANKAELPPQHLSYLHYGIAKALDNLGEFGPSMDHYDKANEIEYRLKFGAKQFDHDEFGARTTRIATTFSRSFILKHEGLGSTSSLPILVVGMMRSGTTLVEQILSSHPDVGAAGEQKFWPDNWRHAMAINEKDVNRAGLLELAEAYCGLLERTAPGRARVVDKFPGNYAGLGVIHLALPHAKIIHIRRDPVDTCLSIYMTPNRTGAEFAHSKANIVRGYREYLRIMEHWKAALPPECLLEVDYEDLVTDGEVVTRSMIEFLGLEWNDQCLSPQNNVRAVLTPSVWQVRQPIYKTSMQRWRKFEPWLGEFAELLKTPD